MFLLRPVAVSTPLLRTAVRSNLIPALPKAAAASRLYAAASVQTSKASIATISDAIKNDHLELEQYFNEIVDNRGNHEHQERFGNQFTWELARHSVAEELIVYPAFEKYMGHRGHEMAEDDRREHHRASFSFSLSFSFYY